MSCVTEQEAALDEAAESHAESLEMREAATQLEAALHDSEGHRCARLLPCSLTSRALGCLSVPRLIA